MVLNPKGRRRRASRPAARRRRNPSALSHARAAHPKRRRRRHNPFGLKMGGGRKILGLPIKEAVSITVGALAVKAVGNFASKWIPGPASPLKKYGTQIGATIVASMIGRKFMGQKMGDSIALGGTIAIALGIVQEYVAPRVPMLAEYDAYGGGDVGNYLPAATNGYGLSDGAQWNAAF